MSAVGRQAAAYLERLVDAGFETRILFGSNQMVWPDAIPAAIDAIQSSFVTAQQERDILFNNAARSLRLDRATIQRVEAGT